MDCAYLAGFKPPTPQSLDNQLYHISHSHPRRVLVIHLIGGINMLYIIGYVEYMSLNIENEKSNMAFSYLLKWLSWKMKQLFFNTYLLKISHFLKISWLKWTSFKGHKWLPGCSLPMPVLNSVNFLLDKFRTSCICDVLLLLQDLIKLHLHQPALQPFIPFAHKVDTNNIYNTRFIFSIHMTFLPENHNSDSGQHEESCRNTACPALCWWNRNKNMAVTQWPSSIAIASIKSADRMSIVLCSVSLTGPVGPETCRCDAAPPEGSRYWADELEQGRLNEQLCHTASIIKVIMRLVAVEARQEGRVERGWTESGKKPAPSEDLVATSSS